MLRIIIKKNRWLLYPLKIFGSLFFEKKYLEGKYFEKSASGWKWLIRSIIWQKLFGFNRHISWPVSPFIHISNKDNIEFDINDLNNFQTFGCYFQNFAAKIVIGSGSLIAPNVGIVTANHDIEHISGHSPGEDVIIGNNCWIGMNAVILPGVILGPNTIVGAGSIVTKSFEDGNVVIAGNPARIIKTLNV